MFGFASGAVAVVGFAVPWLANSVLEDALGGNARSSRVTGAAQREFWAEISDRGEEALITWFGLPGLGYPDGVLIGVAIVGLIIGAIVLHRRERDREAGIAGAVAGVLFVVVLAGAGLTFVSGAFMASPLAIAAAWSVRHRYEPALLAGAMACTVGIWAFQFLGGAGPQWGGRYLLAPTLLLTVLGVVHLPIAPKNVQAVVVAMAVTVSAFGVGWLGQRSHEVQDFFADLAERPEDVIISTNGFLVREAGAGVYDRRYLSLSREAPLEGAVEVVVAAGLDSYAVLTSSEQLPHLSGTSAGVERADFLGVPLFLHSYRLDR